MIASFAISAITLPLELVAIAAGAVGGIAVAALIALLITRELTGAQARGDGAGNRVRLFSRYLAIPIIPLLFVFAVIVAVKVWQVL